jgi:hypothetical protein
VAFGKADIKELRVSLLFDEWKEEEEGMPLPQVWIRIFRLPKKLREFSVLWVLGSMLGATQSVDMISSLKRNYGHVEVTVLNVDLLLNSIDTVVIRDRLFSLPIQVEGPKGHEVHNNQMEVDERNSGVGNSGDGHREEGRDSGPWGDNASKGNEENSNTEPQHSTSKDNKLRRCMALVTYRLM